MTGLRRRTRIAAVGVLLVPVTLATVPAGPQSGAAAAPSAVTRTKDVSRVHLVGGQDVVADQRTVSVTVSHTRDLRDRQGIRVSWSGAHPTFGAVPDPNSGLARQQEYPVVLLECRGVDSATAPAANRLRPETCWTQTSSERFFFSPGLAFPPWRVDRYADPADRKDLVGAPATMPKACFPSGYVERWLPFVAVDGKTYPGGNSGCAGTAPEAAQIDSALSQPSNTTYGVTGPDGRGEARFDVWTAQDNASLGCSRSVACALVVVPVTGISCDVAAAGLPVVDVPAGDEVAAADAKCRATTGFKAGQGGAPEVAVTGALWWSASNWRNRITVPLHFSPLPSECDLVGSGDGVEIYGSELLAQATQPWSSAFCRDPKLFGFRHVQTGEPQARNLLAAGTIDAAFTSHPPDGGYKTPVINAPVAMSGFAVGYSIDDEHRNEFRSLRLTPRLLAKLLTESYPAIPAIKTGYAALSANPVEMSQDPEFIALNPGIPTGVTAGPSAATLLALASDSDVVRSLTAYLDADKEARDWLDGTPDPWGMVVNPNYKGIDLPVDNWPLLDTYQPLDIYNNGTNDCLHANPVPYLPLVAAPASRMATISLSLQFAIAPSQVVCQLTPGGGIEGAKLVGLGRQTVGSRFLVGITSLADALRYQIDTAALRTSAGTFTGPSDVSLRAAAALLKPDTTTGTWPVPYDRIVGPGGAAAYPGAMVVYAAVPTSGLAPADARRFATLLRYAVTTGQTSGLPAGYLPLTAGNGLGALGAYSLRAAAAIAAQQGQVPSLTGGGSVTPVGGSGNGGNPAPVVPPAPAAPAPGGAAPVPVTQPAPPRAAAPRKPVVAPPPQATVVRTAAPGAGLAGAVLPLLVLVALTAVVARSLTGVRRRR